eukprot:2920890-Rhodomonas_salina.1
MCGTGVAYAAMRCVVLASRMLLCDVRYWRSVCCYAMCGTGVAYGGGHHVSSLCSVLIGYATPTAVLPSIMLLGHVQYCPSVFPLSHARALKRDEPDPAPVHSLGLGSRV